MNDEERSALGESGSPLVLHLLASTAFHLVGGGGLLLLTGLLAPTPPARPLIDPDSVIQVSMVTLPLSKQSVPDRPSQAPRPKGEPDPAPAPKPAEPPPPRTADMVHHTPEAPKKPTGVDTQREREELMRRLEMERMLADLEDAPTGPRDRSATSPDGSPDAAAAAAAASAQGDPELQAYIRRISRIFRDNFHPLQAVTRANPKIVCKVVVQIDGNGTITSAQIAQSSNNPSYDRAALTAVEVVKTIPPPPERFRALIHDGYVITFEPENL